ncbi:hypothetical protein TNCV_2426941 [Trichonephila clavipes]|nr:hypothetical protein TNCV_2426941 [Trichonephila clavipes]
MTSSEQWRYVATEDNPADFVSRGMDSLKLKTCELWWNGPKFLMSNQYPQRQIPVAVIKDPDYLNSLQQRNKWHFEKKNAKIGDMVIIKEDNLPSCQWSLGRINNIYPGKDSKIDRTGKLMQSGGCMEKSSPLVVNYPVGMWTHENSEVSPYSNPNILVVSESWCLCKYVVPSELSEFVCVVPFYPPCRRKRLWFQDEGNHYKG